MEGKGLNGRVIGSAFGVDFAGRQNPRAMVIEPESKIRLAFGPFEVNFAADELRRGGVRIRLSGQPMQILRMLLARPGEVVTRDQLREEIWKDGTFVDFEHGLNAAINKLRRALGDSAENPRYVETITGRGYRFIGTLAQEPAEAIAGTKAAVQGLGPTIRESEPHRRRQGLWWWLAAGAAAVVFALGWRIHNAPMPKGPWTLMQLTMDPGLSDKPAISRDGALVAYSSDRDKAGQRDLYLIQAVGAQPLRLTFDGAGNTSPDFSPDGTRIVYHSDRDGGGIYVVPAFGGEPKLLARGGLDPKFSPDGLQVAYWVGAPNVSATIPGSGTVWIVPAAGGQPRRVDSNLTAARFPIWSPDGRSLLMTGYTSQKPYQADATDWWLVAVDGSRAVKADAYDAFARSGWAVDERSSDYPALYGTRAMRIANCWLAPDKLIFYDLGAEARNLWETTISNHTGKVSADFTRLTDGAGNELDPSCATEDRLAFANIELRRNIWSVPFDLNRGMATGELERIKQAPARQDHAALSANGRYLAFASNQAGKMNIWLLDLQNGRETQLASMPMLQRYPVSDATGTRVAFSVYEPNSARSVYVWSEDGAVEKVCDGCFRATDWSRDQNSLLVFVGTPYQINSLDLTTHQQTPILKHANYSLLYARYSPDNRWVSFTARVQPNQSRIMIAPVDGAKPVPESEWIEIAEEGPEDWANWSPDGKILYFTSARDGHTCFWGQRLDAKTHRPVGEAFAALHLHGRMSYQSGGWSAAGGRLAMVTTEDTGNIWIMSREKGR